MGSGLRGEQGRGVGGLPAVSTDRAGHAAADGHVHEQSGVIQRLARVGQQIHVPVPWPGSTGSTIHVYTIYV